MYICIYIYIERERDREMLTGTIEQLYLANDSQWLIYD